MTALDRYRCGCRDKTLYSRRIIRVRAGAHAELIQIAAALKAPVVHALRGKEFVEYDNPYDVGMTGLIGFSSGYRAMEHCDALLMLGRDDEAPVV